MASARPPPQWLTYSTTASHQLPQVAGQVPDRLRLGSGPGGRHMCDGPSAATLTPAQAAPPARGRPTPPTRAGAAAWCRIAATAAGARTPRATRATAGRWQRRSSSLHTCGRGAAHLGSATHHRWRACCGSGRSTCGATCRPTPSFQRVWWPRPAPRRRRGPQASRPQAMRPLAQAAAATRARREPLAQRHQQSTVGQTAAARPGRRPALLLRRRRQRPRSCTCCCRPAATCGMSSRPSTA